MLARARRLTEQGSPDSTVLVERRVVTCLAEGVESVSSSDHDVITDYGPAIGALGVQGRLDAVPGSEMTPLGYGPFMISWALRGDPLSLGGGPFDWGGGEETNHQPGVRGRGRLGRAPFQP